jgi:hypothetical protein
MKRDRRRLSAVAALLAAMAAAAPRQWCRSTTFRWYGQ